MEFEKSEKEKTNLKERNDCPVIGILAQNWKKDETDSSWYIAASYVKFIESAGAQVIPICLDESDEYYDSIYKSINGLLLPGGGGFSLTSSSFAKVATTFMARSREGSKNGESFPIWATCLGLEQMIVSIISPKLELDIQDPNYPLEDCTGCKGTGTVLQKGPDWDKSYFIQSLPTQIRSDILNGKVCAYNWHRKCVPRSVMDHPALSEFCFVATSREPAESGPKEFVGIVENVTLGWFGVQFHPEKAQFEFGRPNQIPHTELAIRFGFECALFFVNEARKNRHIFSDKSKLIYNFQPSYVNMKDWQQIYLFKKKSN